MCYSAPIVVKVLCMYFSAVFSVIWPISQPSSVHQGQWRDLPLSLFLFLSDPHPPVISAPGSKGFIKREDLDIAM